MVHYGGGQGVHHAGKHHTWLWMHHKPSSPCYAHPIHWCNYDHAGTGQDYRFPLLNSVNNYNGYDMTPAWQATLYGKSYLGSSASCLIRGTDYGRGKRGSRYVWALVPNATYLAVAMAPRHAADHPYVENRWELFVDGQYVMPMTARFCGGGHTAVLSATVKAHEVASAQETGLRMAGMRVNTAACPAARRPGISWGRWSWTEWRSSPCRR